MTISIMSKLPLKSTLNFTNSMGEWSPILRNCYVAGGSVERNWSPFWSKWDSLYGVYRLVRGNVVRNYTDIDSNGSALYDAI